MIHLNRNILNLCFILFTSSGVKSQWNTFPFQETCDFIYTAQTGITYLSSTSGWYIYDGLDVPARMNLQDLDNKNIQSSLFLGKGNILWFSTYNRIIRFDQVTGGMQSFPIILQEKDTMQSDYCVFNFDTIDGSLLVKQGLKLIRFDTEKFSSKELADSVTGRRILTYKNASLTYFLSYYYTYSPQIVIMDSRLDGISSVYSWNNWPDSCMANDMVMLDEGRVLLASSKGLMIGDVSTRTITFITDSLFSEGVRALGLYANGKWLISTKGSGLTWLYRKSETGQLYTEPLKETISSGQIDRIVVNDDGILFLVEYGKAIYYQNPLKAKFINFDTKSYTSLRNGRLTEDLVHYGIQSTSATNGGTPFILTSLFKAISESPYRESRITKIGEEDDLVFHPNKAQLYRYYSDLSGSLFADFLGEGLFEFKEGVWTPIENDFTTTGEINFYTRADGIEIASINQEKIDIWRSGVADRRLASLVFAGDLHNAYYDKNAHRFYISTDQGVLQIDQPYDRAELIKETKGLPCYCLLPDRSGNLWYSSEEGMVLFDRENETIKRFTPADGVFSSEYWPGKCSVLTPDSLIFFNEKGFTLVYPPSIFQLEHEAKIHYSKFRVNDLDWPRGDILNFANQWETQFVSNTISFTIQSIDLSDPLNTNVRYKLEGYDPDWIVAGKPYVQVRYPKLPPGHYILKVNGCNSDGKWNQSVNEITIQVHPPFWMTWWFISLTGLLLIGLVYWTVRSYYRRKLEKKNQLLREQSLIIEKQQAIERERTRIASEMHDDLGSGLTTIRYLSDKALMQAKDPEELEQIQRIADHSNTLVQNMSEIIWAMNSRYDDAENLVGYLRRYASEYLDEHQIPLEFDIDERQWDEINVGGEVRRNLFLVFKEILHNTVKYSGATQVSVKVETGDQITIKVIEAGGKGFDPASSEREGNGLYNCRKRMDFINGRISFEKTPEAMHIIFSAPLKPTS